MVTLLIISLGKKIQFSYLIRSVLPPITYLQYFSVIRVRDKIIPIGVLENYR